MLIRGGLVRRLDQEFSAENMNRVDRTQITVVNSRHRCACCYAFVEMEEDNLSNEDEVGEREQRVDKGG